MCYKPVATCDKCDVAMYTLGTAIASNPASEVMLFTYATLCSLHILGRQVHDNIDVH